VRPSTQDEQRELHALFAELCAIRSVSGEERAIADHVSAFLRRLGLTVAEDDSAAVSGAGCGNLLARIPPAQDAADAPWVLLCAHLDTVPHDGVVEPVHAGEGWESAGDTILGADNKAAVAVLLQAARRLVVEPAPVGVELLLTGREETALAGAAEFDVSVLRATVGYVYDHASPVGEIALASPTYYRIQADFLGAAAHAGIRPEEGRSAVRAAARAIVAVPHGRLDERTTANVGHVHGGPPGATNVVPERCTVLAEVRSLDEARVEQVVAETVDAIHDAANDVAGPVDVDIQVARLFAGYSQSPSEPAVQIAEAALRARGYEPRHIVTGGGTDANALMANGGPPVVNLANGTERNHETSERVSDSALHDMLDITYALLDAAAEQLGAAASVTTP
jgi:tripeptide aminopeptidase